jgi:hypothetical protein
VTTAPVSASSPAFRRRFPIWMKLAYSAWVAVLVPVWVAYHGPANFLWFSDVALFGLLIALWAENRLLASMMTIGAIVPELAWVVDWVLGLISGDAPLGIASHMFSDKPLWVRALSLFHLFLPPVMIYTLWKLGYDRRALLWQTLLGWVVLLSAYFFTDPRGKAGNINWVFPPDVAGLRDVPSPIWFVIVMLAWPIGVFVPLHLLMRRLFRRHEFSAQTASPRQPALGGTSER